MAISEAISRSKARFPRLYAAASLKLQPLGYRALALHGFSAALCRGLIEALRGELAAVLAAEAFSAALCRGLIEAEIARASNLSVSPFSAALCRGLIEASRGSSRWYWKPMSFPRLYAAASLKLPRAEVFLGGGGSVFRGFMPRPH